jgi:hypothetical protein
MRDVDKVGLARATYLAFVAAIQQKLQCFRVDAHINTVAVRLSEITFKHLLEDRAKHRKIMSRRTDNFSIICT